MLVPWSRLQPSSRARRWRWVGLAIALCAVGALLAAAFASGPFNWIAASLAAGSVGVAWLALARDGTALLEVGVSPFGEPQLRECQGTPIGLEPKPVRVVFASAWLISFRCGTTLVAIWPDSLPRSTYRQLWVHLRWGRAVPSNGEPAARSINHANQTDR